MTAKITAAPREILAPRKPSHAPHIAIGTKSNNSKGDCDGRRNRERQNRHGAKQAATLTQNVRRETDPTANPPLHAQTSSSTILQINIATPVPATPSAERPRSTTCL